MTTLKPETIAGLFQAWADACNKHPPQPGDPWPQQNNELFLRRLHEFSTMRVLAERSTCADECDRMAAEAKAEMLRQPPGSPARDLYFARMEALRTAATELRLGPTER